MIPPGIRAELHDLGERQVLWQPTTGRSLAYSPSLAAVLASPPAPLARRLRDLGMVDGHPVEDWIPVRTAWSLLVDGTLWHAQPLERGPGGLPFAAVDLDPIERALWRAINGARSLGDLATRLNLDVAELVDLLHPWSALTHQIVQLRPGPTRPTDPGLHRLTLPERPRNHRQAHHYDADGATTLDRYHGEQITDGATHFDDRETTLAHAFAPPHPAFGGRPFGVALAHALTAIGAPEGPLLEIGPGTGELCAALQTAWPDRAITRLDLSPELLRTQAARCPGTRSLLGSATAIPLDANSVDLIVSNEVIADLEAGPSPGDWLVVPEPGQRHFNVGAWQMVAEIARVLKPGGLAYLSEFGALHEHPTETTHLDHPEVSIHFGQLVAVAEYCGLRAEVLPLADLLGADRSARWLCRASYEALRALHSARGRHLEARAWLPETLDLPWRVEGLQTVPITEPGPAPVIDRILAIVLRKP